MSTKPLHQILVRPLLTEKSVKSALTKKYVFAVALNASKTEIADAVEAMFAKEKVKVASVNTLHVHGKTRRTNARHKRQPSIGKVPDWKKAIVTLTADSPNIPMLEGV